MGKEGPKERLGMISREPTWAKKVPRIDQERANLAKKVPRIDQERFQESQLGQRRSQG